MACYATSTAWKTPKYLKICSKTAFYSCKLDKNAQNTSILHFYVYNAYLLGGLKGVFVIWVGAIAWGCFAALAVVFLILTAACGVFCGFV